MQSRRVGGSRRPEEHDDQGHDQHSDSTYEHRTDRENSINEKCTGESCHAELGRTHHPRMAMQGGVAYFDEGAAGVALDGSIENLWRALRRDSLEDHANLQGDGHQTGLDKVIDGVLGRRDTVSSASDAPAPQESTATSSASASVWMGSISSISVVSRSLTSTQSKSIVKQTASASVMANPVIRPLKATIRATQPAWLLMGQDDSKARVIILIVSIAAFVTIVAAGVAVCLCLRSKKRSVQISHTPAASAKTNTTKAQQADAIAVTMSSMPNSGNVMRTAPTTSPSASAPQNSPTGVTQTQQSQSQRPRGEVTQQPRRESLTAQARDAKQLAKMKSSVSKRSSSVTASTTREVDAMQRATAAAAAAGTAIGQSQLSGLSLTSLRAIYDKEAKEEVGMESSMDSLDSSDDAEDDDDEFSGEGRAGGRRLKVRVGWVPQLPDELRLVAGEWVIVTLVHDDGWCEGKQEIGGCEGVFPMECLKSRAWSLFGTQNGIEDAGKLTAVDDRVPRKLSTVGEHSSNGTIDHDH